MHPLAIIGGILCIAAVLRDAFETMILPRRLGGKLRISRIFYRSTWPVWRGIGRLIRMIHGRREGWLAVFGPLSLLILIMLWAGGLIFGYGLLLVGFGSPMHSTESVSGFWMDLYVSGTTFFTLGLGDVVPDSHLGRVMMVIEGGMGFGFLAVLIGYLPVLYSAFSRREAAISMLDARAGSPPTASELLRRHAHDADMSDLREYLAGWELWSAELLESQISYPVLGFFRSQHINQSWLSALTTILDTSALIIAADENRCTRQARLTFAMARHAVVDLAQIFISRLHGDERDRLTSESFAKLRDILQGAGSHLRFDGGVEQRLADLRSQYEPHVSTIAVVLSLELPRWIGDPDHLDNWQRSPWDRIRTRAVDRHF